MSFAYGVRPRHVLLSASMPFSAETVRGARFDLFEFVCADIHDKHPGYDFAFTRWSYAGFSDIASMHGYLVPDLGPFYFVDRGA